MFPTEEGLQSLRWVTAKHTAMAIDLGYGWEQGANVTEPVLSESLTLSMGADRDPRVQLRRARGYGLGVVSPVRARLTIREGSIRKKATQPCAQERCAPETRVPA